MSELIQVRKKAQLTLPQSVRQKLGIEEGDFLDVSVQQGAILLKVKRLIDKSQTWFWTERWQQGEREAEEDIRSGRVQRVEDPVREGGVVVAPDDRAVGRVGPSDTLQVAEVQESVPEEGNGGAKTEEDPDGRQNQDRSPPRAAVEACEPTGQRVANGRDEERPAREE